MLLRFLFGCSFALSLCTSAFGQDLRDVILSSQHNHTRFETTPAEHVMEFRAYTASFDLNDDDNGDGIADQLGVPAWVSYQLNEGDPSGRDERPDDWIAIPNLPSPMVSPVDDTYKGSGYSRGHACMRSHAQRLGTDANYNTYCVINAMPQLQDLNGGHWLSLEHMCSLWANKYGKIWVTCGPVFLEGESIQTIGDYGEPTAAIPDAFYKIVARENPDDAEKPLVLAFVYPHDPELDDSSLRVDHKPFLVSVRAIEELTGLDFFSNLPDVVQNEIESQAGTELWELDLNRSLRRMLRRFRVGGQVDRDLLDNLIQSNASGTISEEDDLSDFEDLVPTNPRSTRRASGNDRTNQSTQEQRILQLEEKIQELEDRLKKIEGNQPTDFAIRKPNSLRERILSSRRNLETLDRRDAEDLEVEAQAETIQIGTYNLELLGKNRKKFQRTARPKRSDADLQEIVDRIVVELDLEIVVFQEINTASENWQTLKTKLASHGYEFFEGTTSEREQYVVLAWDADEIAVDNDTLQELPVRTGISLSNGCNASGLRKPVAGYFKAGEFDFWVVGVHLKSRVGGYCANRVREAQCQELIAETDALIEEVGDRDIIIAGDFNNRIGHFSLKPFEAADFILQTKYLKTGSAVGSYVKDNKPHESDDLIDHIAIRYYDTREVVPNSTYVYNLGSRSKGIDYVMRQSDHVPVWTSFSTVADLDDE